jgi:hypothetical protein
MKTNENKIPVFKNESDEAEAQRIATRKGTGIKHS